MTSWATGLSNLRKWTPMAPNLQKDLFTFYRNDIDIKIAEQVLLASIFRGGFTVEHGTGSTEPTYKNIIENKLKEPKNGNNNNNNNNINNRSPKEKGLRNGGLSTNQDPVLISWLQKLGKDGFRMKMIYGMCPFRMVYDADIDSDIILIPEMASGLFIFRLNEVDAIEVGWMSESRRKSNQDAIIRPDKDTGVFVWPDSFPTMVGKQPFNSLAARLRKQWLIRERVTEHFLTADQMASKPPIVTQSKEAPRSIEHMGYDEILSESVLFGDDDQTVDNMDRRRIDMSAVSRQRQLNMVTTGSAGMVYPVYGPKRTGIDMDGLEYEMDTVSPWLHNQYPLTSGRTTASISVPKPRGDMLNWNKEWGELVHRAFGVPSQMMTAGKKTSAEALSSDARFQTAVQMGRDDIKSFVEEAWAQAMTESENIDLYNAISDLEKKRKSITETTNGKRKREDEDEKRIRQLLTNETVEGEIRDPVSEAALKGDKLVGVSDDNGEKTDKKKRKTLSRYGDDGGNGKTPAESIGKAKAKVVGPSQSSQIQLLHINPDIFTEEELETVEEQLQQRRRLRQHPDVQSEREREALRLQSASGILKESDIERILEIAKLRDIEVDPLLVKDEVMNTSVTRELGKLSEREQRLRKILAQRNRLVWHWDSPLIDIGDIIVLRNEGLINEDTARVLTYTNYELPYDTPAGKSKEERMHEMKHQSEMEKIKEQNKAKADIAKTSAQAKMTAPGVAGASTPSQKTTAAVQQKQQASKTAPKKGKQTTAATATGKSQTAKKEKPKGSSKRPANK